MRALAEASAGTKGKVVTLAHVRVEGGLDRSLFVIGPAAGVEFSWVRMPLRVVIDAPDRECEFGGGLGKYWASKFFGLIFRPQRRLGLTRR